MNKESNTVFNSSVLTQRQIFASPLAAALRNNRLARALQQYSSTSDFSLIKHNLEETFGLVTPLETTWRQWFQYQHLVWTKLPYGPLDVQFHVFNSSFSNMSYLLGIHEKYLKTSNAKCPLSRISDSQDLTNFKYEPEISLEGGLDDHPEFGISANPITIRGERTDYAHQITACPCHPHPGFENLTISL